MTDKFDFLLKNKVENFIGVPDSTMKHFIHRGLEKNKIIISTREEEAISVEIPKIKNHGDLSTNAPMIFAKENNQSPVELAAIIKKQLDSKFKEIIKIEVAKPGFLNFFFNKDFWYNFLKATDINFGKRDNFEPKTGPG